MLSSSPARWTLGPTAGCSLGKLLERLKQGTKLCDCLCQAFGCPSALKEKKKSIDFGEGASIWVGLSPVSFLMDMRNEVGAGKRKESCSLGMWGGFIETGFALAALAKAAVGEGGAELSSP